MFFSFRRVRAAAALFAAALAVLTLAGCNRKAAAPQFERLAILRFENLTGDPSSDWIGRALPDLISLELAGAPGLYALSSSRIHSMERAAGARRVSVPGISAERDLALAAGANRLAYGEYSMRGGKLEIHVSIEDPRTGKVEPAYSASGPAGDLGGIATVLARNFWPGASGYPGAAAVWRAYVAALETNDAPEAERELANALAADPNFAPAYRLLADVRVRAQDRAGAAAAIDKALAASLPPIEKARAQRTAAELRGDRAGLRASVAALAGLMPSDPDLWRESGEFAMTVHAYPEAIHAFQKGLDIEPDNIVALNQLGYAFAWAGDVAGAEGALRRYQALRPNEPNPLDSLGDAYLINGRLREAEAQYLQAAQKQPHFLSDGDLLKVAMARLMTGDVAGADALARKYVEARIADKDPAAPYRAAEWAWTSGRRKDACRQLESFAASVENTPLRELAARAYAELATWKRLLGDRAGATVAAGKAVALAGPASSGIAAVARFLTEDEGGAAGLTERANRAFGPGTGPVREFAIAYAQLLARDFQGATRTLEKLYQDGGPADEGLPALLAWTYMETGRTKEAAALLRTNPIPQSGGPGPLFGFVFPRLYQLRSAVAQSEGKQDEAKLNASIFQKLSGPDPLIWDAK